MILSFVCRGILLNAKKNWIVFYKLIKSFSDIIFFILIKYVLGEPSYPIIYMLIIHHVAEVLVDFGMLL